MLTDFERVVIEGALIHYAKHCDAMRDEQGPSAEEAAKTARALYVRFVERTEG